MLKRFGKYELLQKLGSGGMADVFAARCETTAGRKVCAVKVFRSPTTHNATLLALFSMEGELAMKLTHGNIVQVFDVGEHNGCPYIAMEIIDGVSLACFLEAVRARHPDRPSLAEAIYITGEVLHALHHVHTFTENGVNPHIVHRDVSPQNILVTSRGEIKLTDFGIARVVDGRTTDRVYGKLSYMPREQYMGDPVQQSDLFAAGAVFYELVTGHKLRAGCRNQAEIHDAIVAGRLPVLPDVLPSMVYDTLAGLLDVDPARRTQSAKDALRLMGMHIRSGNPKLDTEELYLSCIGRRRSWYSELTEQADATTARGPRAGGEGKAPKRMQSRRPTENAAAFEANGKVETEAPISGRAWETAQRHDAAIDDVTTSRWRRPATSEGTSELRP